MDCPRYWVSEMQVDGFRFDLAPVLGRGDHGFDPHAAFFAAVAQDPVLSRVKLIAEPWDIGPGGYQVGGFPADWLEWNDQFRDTVRSFWLQPGGAMAAPRAAFARQLCGWSDLFQRRGRVPAASVNYVVSHDGFTLRHLVSHAERHNLANGEGNRDGRGHNLSCNCGVEGPTDDPAVNELRSTNCAAGFSARCWRPHCSPRARRCWLPATTNLATRSKATTTPTARTTRSPGSIDRVPTRR
jgi:glycogen operon protein